MKKFTGLGLSISICGLNRPLDSGNFLIREKIKLAAALSGPFSTVCANSALISSFLISVPKKRM